MSMTAGRWRLYYAAKAVVGTGETGLAKVGGGRGEGGTWARRVRGRGGSVEVKGGEVKRRKGKGREG